MWASYVEPEQADSPVEELKAETPTEEVKTDEGLINTCYTFL